MIVPRRKEPPHSTFLASQESPAFELLSETCSLRRIFLVEDGGLSDGSRDRLVDAALRKAVSLSCPEVDPFARRVIDLYAVAARVEHRRYHELGADHKLVLQAEHLGIVRVMYEGVPDDRESRFVRLLHQFDPVGFPGGVDLREAGEVREGFHVRVDLVVELGYVALVGAEDGREGAELDPAQEELFGAMKFEQGIVYGGVAADVRVFEAIL